MGLGGGNWVTQNEVIPGSYINVKTQVKASVVLSERGTVALPIALNWGTQGAVYTITAEDFEKNSVKLLGYDYSATEMMPFREAFKNAKKALVYNLATGGEKAAMANATAKYAGERGNDLKLVVQKNIDDESKFDVTLYMGSSIVDKQTVAAASELAENAFVTWKDAELAATAGTPFTGGTNGTVDTAAYQNALNALENKAYNILVCNSTDESVKSLFESYTIRLRETVGIKFQTVGYRMKSNHYGVISVENEAGESGIDAIYWVAGAEAGTAGNKSVTNRLYNGELEIACPHTQSELAEGIKDGKFMFHIVEDEVRVLTDINTFTAFTEEQGEDFASNQFVRIMDQFTVDRARIFNTKYVGQIQNDNDGRISYWGDIVNHARELERQRYIENYDSSILTVNQGNNRKSVLVFDAIKPVCAMEILYMEITVTE